MDIVKLSISVFNTWHIQLNKHRLFLYINQCRARYNFGEAANGRVGERERYEVQLQGCRSYNEEAEKDEANARGTTSSAERPTGSRTSLAKLNAEYLGLSESTPEVNGWPVDQQDFLFLPQD